MTEDELLVLLRSASEEENVSGLVGNVAKGEYSVWREREKAAAQVADATVACEVLHWALRRIIEDLEEHGEEHAIGLYEGHDLTFFRGQLEELAPKLEQTPQSPLGHRLRERRLGGSPRDRFQRVRNAIDSAVTEGNCRAFAAAVPLIDEHSKDLVFSWLERLVMQATIIVHDAWLAGDKDGCRAIVLSLIKGVDGLHGDGLKRRLRHKRALPLGSVALELSQGNPELEELVRTRMKVPT